MPLMKKFKSKRKRLLSGKKPELLFGRAGKKQRKNFKSAKGKKYSKKRKTAGYLSKIVIGTKKLLEIAKARRKLK